jgi:hypothetical protein
MRCHLVWGPDSFMNHIYRVSTCTLDRRPFVNYLPVGIRDALHFISSLRLFHACVKKAESRKQKAESRKHFPSLFCMAHLISEFSSAVAVKPSQFPSPCLLLSSDEFSSRSEATIRSESGIRFCCRVGCRFRLVHISREECRRRRRLS